MLINIRIEAEIDQKAWAVEYGTRGDVNDVENYVQTLLTMNPAAEAGAIKLTGYVVEEI
jgi:hypothetical protein